MNEKTMGTSEVTADLNDVDVSDIDFNAIDAETDKTDDEATGDTAPKADEADKQKQAEGEADKDSAKDKETKETDQFTLKHLDEVKTVSREEVIALAQKGMDYDRIRAKVDELTKAKTDAEAEKAVISKRLEILGEIARQSGYKDVDELLDYTMATNVANRDGIDVNVALQKIRLDRREKELAEKEARLSEDKSAKNAEAEAAKKAEEKRDKDFDDFAKSKYGGIKPEEIPPEVWKLYGDGQQGYTLLQAFMEVRTAKLEEEIAAQKKNSDNAARSTGSATTAGKQKIVDPWLADLESRM